MGYHHMEVENDSLDCVEVFHSYVEGKFDMSLIEDICSLFVGRGV